jgi:hypothetical protein
VLLSVMILTDDNSPNVSNSRVSHSSSTFHESWPTKRFFLPASSPEASVLDFFEAGAASASALRFVDGADSCLRFVDGAGSCSTSSSEDSSSSSESDSDSADPSLPDSSAEDA